MRRSLIFLVGLMMSVIASAQTTLLADFEDGTAGNLKINKDYQGSLFSVKPSVMDNPSKTGLNTSDKCAGATNKADADWQKNFIILDLKEPVVISDENRILTMLAYRSIQPKDMRIGFNGYEEAHQLYIGKLSADATWERISIDLADFVGKTLKTIYIVLSCNWSDPRSGWGEATYCFDDISLGAGEALPPAEVKIDLSKTYQTVQDFGASDCWTAEYISDYFSTTEKEKAARWLFSQQMDGDGNPEGIGLSCWRVNIGAGSAEQGSNSNIDDETRRAECYLKSDGTYDWTKCNGQQWFMKQAKDYGVDHFLLFSNSAPVYQTKTGKANTNGQDLSCNLKDDCYDDFAEFLATTTKHFVDEGYNVTYIDPVNEPRFEWKDGQEGSPWENANIAKLAKELNKSIVDRELTTKILIPEASSWDLLYSGTGRASNQINAFFKSGSSTYIGDLPSLAKVVAGHSYWTFTNNTDLKNIREEVRDAANEYGLEVIQTEWSMLDTAPSTSAGFPASYEAATKMDIALYMGKLIYCDLNYGNMSGWSYWTSFAQEKYSQKNRFYLIRMNAKGDTGEESYGDIKEGGTLTADKNLWVLGNYSRFIRPGYQRVDVSGADEMNALMGSSWLSPNGKTLVTVMVNMNRTSRKIGLTLTDKSIDGIKTYVTDKEHDLQLVSSLNDATNLEIPARSVVTVVATLGNSTGISEVRVNNRNDDRIYSLNGQLISRPQKGIYIKNGKKYIVK
ncbi:glycoside hydrolase [Prevotella sp. P6B1]|uniref:glycoside hydrolase n=1 Tax=Prevotella sp. P6B1 TaxID=1410613 RepID=UPI0009DD4E56|nr:glycoside hydrolase [Prevotella sp. P6B1]